MKGIKDLYKDLVVRKQTCSAQLFSPQLPFLLALSCCFYIFCELCGSVLQDYWPQESIFSKYLTYSETFFLLLFDKVIPQVKC